MTRLEHIQAEIEALPTNEFARLRDWITQKDWELWDKQIEVDSSAGKLDFLVQEALEAKAKGKLTDL
ncbi:MAG: hypothetical protein ABFS02_09970 [Pseudomonadota bacterium]